MEKAAGVLGGGGSSVDLMGWGLAWSFQHLVRVGAFVAVTKGWINRRLGLLKLDY